MLASMRSSRKRAMSSGPVSPGVATMLVGVGHTVWGLLAYRREVTEIVQAGVVDSVGDGLFQREHSHDGRAAGFWFLMVGPLVSMLGYLAEGALRRGDREAVRVTAAGIAGVGALGVAVMPRSGFPLTLPLSLWFARRARG
jgi:hypothetical protein